MALFPWQQLYWPVRCDKAHWYQSYSICCIEMLRRWPHPSPLHHRRSTETQSTFLCVFVCDTSECTSNLKGTCCTNFLSCSLNSWGSSRAFRKINWSPQFWWLIPPAWNDPWQEPGLSSRCWDRQTTLARQAKKSWGNVSLYQSTKVDWSRPITL